MSLDDDGFDLTQEPKKVFVNFLIFNIKQIELQIFFMSTPRLAVKSLRGLIGSLDAKSQKNLDKQYQRLVGFEETGNCKRRDIETIYNEVNAYLHKTYLKEVGYAKPRFRSGKLEVPSIG